MKGIQALYGPPVSSKDFPEDLEDKQNDEDVVEDEEKCKQEEKTKNEEDENSQIKELEQNNSFESLFNFWNNNSHKCNELGIPSAVLEVVQGPQGDPQTLKNNYIFP